MQKCALCDKKIPKDAKFCPLCGWDLTDHELTPSQMARIQEEIVDARFGYMRWHVAMVPLLTVAIVFSLLGMLALNEVIPATWDFMAYIALAFVFIGIPFAFFRDRHQKRQNRLKIILRDRQPSQ